MLIVSQRTATAAAIDELLLIWTASDAEELVALLPFSIREHVFAELK